MDQTPKTVLDVVREARVAEETAQAQALADAQAQIAAQSTATEGAPTGGAEKGAPEAYAFKALPLGTDGVIVGIGAVADNVDLDDETLAQKGLVSMAYDFCAGDRTFKANHGDELKADLVCSWPGAPILASGKVLEKGAAIPEDDAIVGISLEKGKETHWFVGVRPHDREIVETARKGGIAGFSWGAHVKKTAVK